MTDSNSPVRIDRIKLSNYRFFHGDFELSFSGKNILIYGENGSGKSSVYRALELLTKNKFDTLTKEKNLFIQNDEPLVEYGFSNKKELILHANLEELPDGMDFIKGLSIFTPLLDYKKLLRVHYTSTVFADTVNVYDMLRELFKDYPREEGGTLGGVKDFQKYFGELEDLVNGDLLGEINRLILNFDRDFKVNQFQFSTEFTNNGRPEPVIKIEVDFHETLIDSYHSFLNEARLFALAVSIYFASIKKLLGTLTDESLKILVLDDLLISFDMNNRLKVLDILQTEFTDFQIFFFTHDKELFEIYKNKMVWDTYELYLDDTETIPKPIVKKGSSDIERAKEFYAKKEYDCSALLLRKAFEKVLKSYLTLKEQRDQNCNELDLAGLVRRAIAKSDNNEAKKILEKLDIDRKHILNPLSHNDDRNIYAQELKIAIIDLEKLKEIWNRSSGRLT